MLIEVFSDVICPWCYLGEHRLGTALDRLDDPEAVQVRFRAFQLDPNAPRQPQDLQTAVDRKYGPGAFEVMSSRLTALGTREGLEYRFDRAQRVNTFDAHRLLAWAGSLADQRPLARALFGAYFTDGADVADHDVLSRLAASVGLDAAEAARILADGDFAAAVAADREAALEREITGVPAFVLAGRWTIPGAQEVETFDQVLRRALARFGDAA